MSSGVMDVGCPAGVGWLDREFFIKASPLTEMNSLSLTETEPRNPPHYPPFFL